MRLRILPGSLWLAYTARNTRTIERMLPPDLTLTSSPLYRESCDTAPKLLFNAYCIDSTYMKGHRIEVQVLAEHRRHGTLHFVVLDCCSDTLLWDPLKGIAMPNAAKAVLRNGARDYDFRMRDRLSVQARKEAHRTPVGYRFVVNANLACYFRGHPTPFPMTFNATAVSAPVTRLLGATVQNDLWSDYRDATPTHAFVHDHPMEYDVDVADYF